jgi:hypothetical protein
VSAWKSGWEHRERAENIYQTKTPLFAKRGFNYFLIGQSYERQLRRLAARNPPNESAPAARKPSMPGSGTAVISWVKLYDVAPLKEIL